MWPSVWSQNSLYKKHDITVCFGSINDCVMKSQKTFPLTKMKWIVCYKKICFCYWHNILWSFFPIMQTFNVKEWIRSHFSWQNYSYQRAQKSRRSSKLKNPKNNRIKKSALSFTFNKRSCDLVDAIPADWNNNNNNNNVNANNNNIFGHIWTALLNNNNSTSHF